MMETIVDIKTPERIDVYILKDEADAKTPVYIEIADMGGVWVSVDTTIMIARALLAAAGDQERPSVDEISK